MNFHPLLFYHALLNYQPRSLWFPYYILLILVDGFLIYHIEHRQTSILIPSIHPSITLFRNKIKGKKKRKGKKRAYAAPIPCIHNFFFFFWEVMLPISLGNNKSRSFFLDDVSSEPIFGIDAACTCFRSVRSLNNSSKQLMLPAISPDSLTFCKPQHK